MTLFPLPLAQIFGHWGAYVVYLIIGLGFGYVLESAGFGNSKKLAAQFYFKDMTVLKVMFSAIVVAMVLIFATSALGWLDYNLIWVNPTYLWPGIVGGLIMGFGFIIGGFCPGTSLVAAATGKLDGVFFVLGVLFGIFMFGESVGNFDEWWHSSYMGRFTLPELFGLPTGVIVLLVVLMALGMFWGAEKLEQRFGGHDPKAAPRWRFIAAATLLAGAVAVTVLGQPTTTDRWQTIAGEKEALLAERAVQIHPGELLGLIHDAKIRVRMLDVRSESDYNLFHILDAEHVPAAALVDLVPVLHLEPANTVFVVMSNDETAATAAWKTLVAESVPNVYILEGGVNNWITTFTRQSFEPAYVAIPGGDDELRYAFAAALGSVYAAAEPDPHLFELAYTPKVKLELKRAPTSGGCG
jgi:rhodanese-related sulfurtransferase